MSIAGILPFMRANKTPKRPFFNGLLLLFCLSLLGGCGKSEPTPNATESPGVQATASPAASTATPTTDGGTDNSGSTQSGNGESAKDPKETGVQAADAKVVLGNAEKGEELLQKANFERGSNNYAAAAELYNEALMADPKNFNIPYEGGCNFALWGKDDLALETLHVAADLGFSDSSALESNVALDTLRENPRFTRLEAKVEANQNR